VLSVARPARGWVSLSLNPSYERHNNAHRYASAASTRAQLRVPLWKLVRSYFSFGLRQGLTSCRAGWFDRFLRPDGFSWNSILCGACRALGFQA
jgi:hypothetical protein